MAVFAHLFLLERASSAVHSETMDTPVMMVVLLPSLRRTTTYGSCSCVEFVVAFGVHYLLFCCCENLYGAVFNTLFLYHGQSLGNARAAVLSFRFWMISVQCPVKQNKCDANHVMTAKLNGILCVELVDDWDVATVLGWMKRDLRGYEIHSV